MVKFLNQLVKGLGPTNFTVVYAVVFTSLVNAIAFIINAIMKNPAWTTNQLVMYIVGYFFVGIFLARQIIKKSV